ncbi:MAG: MmcQ/YjbR family DNA-binding protein [Clostridium sp.]|jgi:predicted DNA-binding protein (MmcQ/YjbR family)|uniref:MmcQ/YjbR family DNA-binding protein n=1 Tax=Clostridium sp. AF37-5 TaxID=2293016 RepID=UPI000E4C0A02|nr:MmcQ/YjbR family DNA-binding protein [Lachnospiraceae bacterium]RHO95194.1 hypothetical protein DW019_12130 [Clostridium sp. AF37-5]
MRYSWLDDYLMDKPAVTKDFKIEWNWIRYFIGGKMFAAVLLDKESKPYYINLKLEPLEGDFWRTQYEDIVPGYYSNKQHWNSIKPDGTVPDELLKELLDKSYELVFRGLSKKKQQETLITTYCGLDCTGCEWREPCNCNGCVSSKGFPFHCKEKACPIASCAINRDIIFCGMCKDFPCQLLIDYSCDKEHGDTPSGARIEACRLIKSLLKK